MEIVLALAIGVLTGSGVWLLLRPRTFQVIMGLSLLFDVAACVPRYASELSCLRAIAQAVRRAGPPGTRGGCITRSCARRRG